MQKSPGLPVFFIDKMALTRVNRHMDDRTFEHAARHPAPDWAGRAQPGPAPFSRTRI